MLHQKKFIYFVYGVSREWRKVELTSISIDFIPYRLSVRVCIQLIVSIYIMLLLGLHTP